jgi:hypothetical protein
MGRITASQVRAILDRCDVASDGSARGRAFEDVICYVFGQVPGVAITRRNSLNAAGSEEIDVAFWNRMHPRGFYFLPRIILVECKNWSQPVGSSEVDWFGSKLRRRGLSFGVLFAANGITGDNAELTAAHDIIRASLAEGCQIVVVTRNEIEQIPTTEALVRLMQEKLCELAVSGSLFL